MHYDPIKDIVEAIMKRFPFVRKLFFLMLDLLFLRQWYVKRAIRKYFPKNQSIRFYDAGAGFCQYSDFILSNWIDSKVLALDLKSDYLNEYSKYALRNYNNRFEKVCEDLVTYTPDKSFNLILAIDILEHIVDDFQVLSNFNQCLDNYGKLIISTPSDKDFAADFVTEHVRSGYNKEDILYKLNQSGFQILSFKYSYGKLGKIAWVLSMKLPMLMLSISKYMVLVLAIYYLCLYPLIYLLMLIDINTDNKSGNGIIIVAEKKSNAS